MHDWTPKDFVAAVVATCLGINLVGFALAVLITDKDITITPMEAAILSTVLGGTVGILGGYLAGNGRNGHKPPDPPEDP